MRSELEIIQAHYARAALGDISGMVADFAVDIEWTEMAGFPYAGSYQGMHQIINKVFYPLGKDWSGFEAIPDSYVTAAADVVVFGTYFATHQVTKNKVTARFTHHWRVIAEEIVYFEQYTDTLLFAQAMQN